MNKQRELEKFGKLLVQSRKDLELTQKELLEQLHKHYGEKYSKGDISKWERGYYRPPVEVVEILETDILKKPAGLLLDAAQYFEEAEYRRQQYAISQLKLYLKKQTRLLAAANNLQFIDPDTGEWETPSIEDLLESYRRSTSPGS